MNKKILFITYSLSEKKGIGSARSRALLHFLKQTGYNIQVVPESQNTNFYSRYIWLIKTLMKIIFFKNGKIYLSVGPFFPLLPIVLICFMFKKNLVVDFRDPWSLNILTKYGKYEFNWNLPRSIKFKISACIEKFTYRTCSAFIVCTKGMKLAYSDLFKDHQKIHLILNGYNFTQKTSKQILNNNKQVLNFICVGKFAEYNYQKAQETIKQLVNILIEKNQNFSFTFIGCDKQLNEKIFSDLQISQVNFLSRMSYEKVIEHINTCDIGLTLVRNQYIEYGTKIFDYIGMGKPVWALVNKSQPFYAEFKNCLIIDKNFNINISQNTIDLYHRSNQFQKFLEIL